MTPGTQRPVIQTHRAAPAEIASVIRTLSRAFQTESALSFILPDHADRQRRLPKAFRIIAGQDMRHGQIFATEGLEALTMWRAPGKMRDSGWDDFRLGIPYALAFGGSVGRGITVAGLIKKNLPSEDCWYLHYAACDPAFQGKGYGGAAIRAGLAMADADRAKAYLETADEKNLAIYAALGFEVVKTWQVPNGPQFWGMMRPARSIL
jgi:RimJ/RimL family protein N-acetyltransferase